MIRTLPDLRIWFVYALAFRKFDDLTEELDACLARHAHACTRVMAARTGRKIGEGEGEVPRRRAARGGQRDRRGRGGGGGGRRGSEQKGGAPSSEATVRTRRGIASHTGPSAGTGPDGDRNSAGPTEPGPGARGPRSRGPCSRQRQRQARASHATRTRPSRPSREHKPRFFFILGATFSPPSLPPLHPLVFLLFFPLRLLDPPFSPLLLLPAPPSSFSCFRLFFSETLDATATGPGVTSHFYLFFFFFIKLPRGLCDFFFIGRCKKIFADVYSLWFLLPCTLCFEKYDTCNNQIFFWNGKRENGPQKINKYAFIIYWGKLKRINIMGRLIT